MKKAFVRYGIVSLAAVLLISLGIALVLTRPAQAQGNGGTDFTDSILSGPIELSNAPGQKLQMNVTLFSKGRGMHQAQTTFDILIDVFGPAGVQSIRQTLVVPHLLDGTGRTCRLALVQTTDNIDVYQDGNMVRHNALNGLPPGEPWIGCVVNSQTGTNDHGSILLDGTIQVFAPDGHTIQAYKSHELSGNVTLIK